MACHPRLIRHLVAGVALAVLMQGPVIAQPLQVGTTNTLLADFTRAIGGEGVQVRALVPPNVSPSKYQLRPADIRTVSGYQLFLRGEWEGWSEKIVNALEGSEVVIGTLPIETGGVWGEPDAAKAIADEIAGELLAIRPEAEADLQYRLAALHAAIDRAHAEARAVLASHRGAPVTICQNGLKFMIGAFGLTIVSQLIDKDKDSGMAGATSPRRVARIIDESRERDAKLVIFAPQLGLQSKCELIGREAGIASIQVPLIPGSMAAAETYEAMIVTAARRIAESLGPQ